VSIEARLPDGTTLRFPAGTADDVVDRAVQEHIAGGERLQAGRDANAAAPPGDNLQRSIISGLTFGLADEFNAGVRAIGSGVPWNPESRFPIGERYSRALAAERGRNQAFQEDRPVAATAGNLAGGVMGPGVALRGATQGAGLVQRLLRSAPSRGAVAGATGGAAAGFGEGEGGLSERADNALTGGAVGAGAGAALGAGINFAGRVGGRVMDVVGLRNPEVAADRQVLRALERDNVPVDELAGRVQGSGAPTMLADLGGRNTTNLAAVAANTPGRAMEAADAAIEARRMGRPDRLTAASDQAFGGGSGGDVAATRATLAEQRAEAARPLYERAWRIQLTPDEYARVSNFVEDPVGQEAFRRGLRIAELEALRPGGSGFNPADFGVVRGANGEWVPAPGQTPNMRLMDAVKRGFDEIVEGYRDPTTGRLNLDQYGRAVDGARAAYRNELAGMFPPYRRALEAWSGPSQSMDAIQRGQQAFRVNRDVTASAAERIAPGDRPFFELGAGRAVSDMVSDPQRAVGNARSLVENRQMQQRLETVLPDQARRQALIDELTREMRFAATDRAVSPRAGSQTARLFAAGEDMGNDPPGGVLLGLLQATSQGGLAGGAARMGASAYRRAQGINPSTADALASRLLSADPAQNAGTVGRLMGRAEQDAARAAIEREFMARLLRGVGVVAAPEGQSQ
jgi:hypothetical protein